jgi:hypothetical protein
LGRIEVGDLGIWGRKNGKRYLAKQHHEGRGSLLRAATTKGTLDLWEGEERGGFGGWRREIDGGGAQRPAALLASREGRELLSSDQI